MKERGIPFMGSMVNAVLGDRKSQTRRPVKGLALDWLSDNGFTPAFVASPENHLCPYGVPGDRLWVREHWRTVPAADKTPPRELIAAHRIWYEAEAPQQPGFGRFRPGMFMYRWMSRILLEVLSVRIERLQDISEADAIAEGCDPEQTLRGDDDIAVNIAMRHLENQAGQLRTDYPIARYMVLWESINGAGSWAANPWVWVVEFKRIP